MDENKNSKPQGQSAAGSQPLPASAKPEEKKTTPDEGETFDKDTVFVCVQDCYQHKVRYRKGDELTGTVCPAYFAVKPQPAEDKNKK